MRLTLALGVQYDGLTEKRPTSSHSRKSTSARKIMGVSSIPTLDAEWVQDDITSQFLILYLTYNHAGLLMPYHHIGMRLDMLI